MFHGRQVSIPYLDFSVCTMWCIWAATENWEAHQFVFHPLDFGIEIIEADREGDEDVLLIPKSRVYTEFLSGMGMSVS